ncbi:MAG: thioredoxin domain-containing protein [Bacteriovoracales bacterium]|nr:thioredoxin domain-containing protein [Bacteriovoracales bacterium]
MEALQEAAKSAQADQLRKRREEEKKELEKFFNEPLKPVIRKDENIRGNAKAPITLVEYSDFECPFCSRAFVVVEELRKKYGDKLRFIYKHLPLSFHSNARMAAMYYEGIRMQSGKKAWKFHDELLKNLNKVKNGEKYFKSLARKLKVNMKKLVKDVRSEKVKNRIKEDEAEAKKFGILGTPGFIINGIPVKGAQPAAHFHGLIDKLKGMGKLSI